MNNHLVDSTSPAKINNMTHDHQSVDTSSTSPMTNRSNINRSRDQLSFRSMAENKSHNSKPSPTVRGQSSPVSSSAGHHRRQGSPAGGANGHQRRSPLSVAQMAASQQAAVSAAAIDQQNRMKGWILEQEFYLEQNRLSGG